MNGFGETREDRGYPTGMRGILLEYRWLFFWVIMASLVFIGIWIVEGKQLAIDFAGGYIIELSLSVDNLFVFLFIFMSFHINEHAQHRVLNYGIAGTIFLRFLFIFVGLSLVNRFEWIFYVFGGLLILSGFKMVFQKEDDEDPHDKPMFRFLRKILPMTTYFEDEKFFVKKTDAAAGGHPSWIARHSKVLFTPMFAVMILIIVSDVIFAIDSVPAVLSMTRNIYIVYASNFFAVMGMRQLFFVIEHVQNRFAYVKYAVAVILMFTGAKMIIEIFDIHVDNLVSIAVICGLLAAGIIVSAIITRAEERASEEEVEVYEGTGEDDAGTVESPDADEAGTVESPDDWREE